MGDTGSIPGWKSCPRVGNGNSLQYSCLENCMDRGAWQTAVHGVIKHNGHGKVFKRSYINENHISFHPELRIQEDSFFNGLAFHFTEKKTYIDSLTYVWKWTPNSITRSNDAEYQYSGMAAFVRAIDLMLEEIFIREGGHVAESSIGTVCQVTYYLYFLTQCNHWKNIDQKWLDMLAEATAKFYTKYIGFYMGATDAERQIIYHRERQRMTGQNLGIETETFDQYMNIILAKYAPQNNEEKELKYV